jgi:hypothetical protein
VTSLSCATGLGVFRTLAKLANEQKARAVIGEGSDSYRTSQKEIAGRAMVRQVGGEGLRGVGEDRAADDRVRSRRRGSTRSPELLHPPRPPATYEWSSDGDVTQRKNGVLTPSEAVSDVSSE